MNAGKDTCKLLNLPYELKEHICLYSFSNPDNEGSTWIKWPKEPALLQASRSTRHETLPLFYQHFPLRVLTYVKCDSFNNIWLTTKKWYHQLPAYKIRHIRLLELRFAFLERYFGEPVEINFFIARSRHGQYTIHHSFGAGWYSDANRKGDPADCEEVLLILRGHLETTLTTLLASPGVEGLTADGIDRLVAIDPDIFP
ncbi:Hypothetical predicted protein [Lecanosticta acicola]|uniref:Uncharacterized protein n=1 Tax=Lecanosticta acicola TaxID=111012 RepID=A0AAI8Z1A8_9PEZI|nr:Hypothetical predicted protein [Lecanosticta acicola]